jgi:predicted nucleic acid-binding protein
MRAFFDTSVLVAAFLEDHEHHERSFARLAQSHRDKAACAAHSLAELYATLTRLPGRFRLTPDQTLLLLASVEEKMEIVFLESREYQIVIREAAGAGIVGGTIYDALLAACALKVNATRIYTWNVAHFQKLSQEVARRVQTP